MMRAGLALMIMCGAVAIFACGKSDGEEKKLSGNGSAARATTKKYGAGDTEGCEIFGHRTMMNADAQIPRDADATPGLRDQIQIMNRLVGRVITIRCMTDGWSAEALACGEAAKDPQIECFHMLSPKQSQKVRDEIQASVTELLSRPGPLTNKRGSLPPPQATP